ncbi:MAG: EAL domain-containing protein [Prochloraceae cyanobacterium]
MKSTNHQLNELPPLKVEANQNNSLAWKQKPEKLFEVGQFELWYQPVYQAESGEVLHNEVLLRWRDDRGNLYLPDEFMPVLSRAGLLQRLDRLVISKAIDCLAHNPQLKLSVNLSGSSLEDLNLIEEVRGWLSSKEVEPQRLSWEITESALAKDFSAAVSFVQRLKNLGCLVVLDNFASRQLSLAQCQQLQVDVVKLNEQFLESLNAAPENQTLAQAILELGQSMGQVTAKCVTDDTGLKLVKEAGLDGIQGNRLKMAAAHPEVIPWIDVPVYRELATVDLTSSVPAPESKEPLLLTEKPEKPSLLRRLLFGTAFVGLGVAALTIGMTSIGHRMSHLVVENAQINARVIRLRATIDGQLEAFYPSPGVVVKKEQVLARIRPSQEVKQEMLQLEQEVKSKLNQLAAAEESLVFLRNRLLKQENEYEKLWKVEITRDVEDVKQKKAILDKAIAQANAARSDYQRFHNLYQQGVVTEQRAEQAKAAWEIAQAEVRRAQEALRSARVGLNAARKKVAMNEYPNWGDSFVEETTQLRQQIENESILVKTLKAEVEIARERLAQAQSLYSGRQEIEIKAPLAAVVYKTEREQGESIERSEAILSLLDCNDIWIEAIVSAKSATQIDTQKSVLVELAGETEPLRGEVVLIQAVSSQGNYERAQKLEVDALLPTIDPKLVGQPLSRVTVKIPPPAKHTNNQQFCGLGQPARLTFATKTQPLVRRWLSW